jgi:hypothetical protein
LDRLDKSPSLRGTPDTALARSAGSRQRALITWKQPSTKALMTTPSATPSSTSVFGRVKAFAEAPSRARLDAFNRAIRAHIEKCDVAR